MKHHSVRQSAIHIFILALILSILGVSLISFRTAQVYGDFLKQLGLTKQEADEKITGSFLGGSLYYYGILNLKKVVLNDRAAIVKDVAVYAKQFASSSEYIKQYMQLKENNKPKEQNVDTPEELRQKTIEQAKEGVRLSEESLKKATADMKLIFEKTLESAKQNLKNAEDPNNRSMKSYAQNFSRFEIQVNQMNEQALKDWEAKYPTNHLLYIKVRLQQFLDATKDIDFNAQLTERNKIKYFVNPEYERKSHTWKLAFRAGKDAVEAGRAFAEQWMSEIE
ncbi:MAG: hypothetical protein ACXWCG_05700 [Flavitalea sp.]